MIGPSRLFQLWSSHDTEIFSTLNAILMVSCQKGPTRHANAWQIGPFWQDTFFFFFFFGGGGGGGGGEFTSYREQCYGCDKNFGVLPQ